MTAEEAVAYIESQGWSKTRLGLDRTRELLRRLGDPQRRLKFIHVTGSNGKGSTCAMLEAVLRAAGYCTGLYISPHIQDFRERIQVAGAMISPQDLAARTEEVKAAAEAMEDHPSQFELSTALALSHFARAGCDVVVLEVGMGGALDSTNAIDAPEVAVVTNVGLEHTEYLGDTLAAIARTKAGIVKPGCDCVCYAGPAEAVDVVRDVCAGKGVPFHLVDFGALAPLEHSLSGQRFRWRDRTWSLPLLGAHQLKNAATALTVLEVLRARGWHIPDAAVARGLETVVWPARFEVLWEEPRFILDGGHNPQCAGALGDILADYLPGERVTFLMGVLADKDWRQMVELVAPHAARFLCVTPESPRALPAQELADYLMERGMEARAFGRIEDAIDAALAGPEPTVAFGSLYMAGHIRTALPRRLKAYQRKLCTARRAALTEVERARYSAALCAALQTVPQIQAAHTVLSYRAVGPEADLPAFHDWCRAQGKTLAFPVTDGAGGMEAYVPERPEDWEAGRYGIPSPAPETCRRVPPEELDAVVVPCVGFDRHGGRLGRGAGYYDRYLARCPQAAHVLPAFDVQELPRVATEATDLPVDLVVTPEGACSGGPSPARP